MERESFKEYSEAAIVEKKMKSCFRRALYIFIIGGDISAELNKQSVKEISSS